MTHFPFYSHSSTRPLNNSAVPLINRKQDEIIFTAAAASVSSDNIRVRAAGQDSDSYAITYGGPDISLVSPASGLTSGTALTITGSEFASAQGSVTVGSGAFDCSVSLWQTDRVECEVVGQGSDLDVRVTTDIGLTATQSSAFSFQAPSISSTNPTLLQTAPGETLVITGTNFGVGVAGSSSGPVTVTIDSAACTVTARSHTEITCTAPEGEGVGKDLVVTVSSQASSASISYKAPVLDAMYTTAGNSPAGGDLVSLTGTNLGVNPSVQIGGAACAVQSRTHISVDCLSPAGTPGTTVSIELIADTQVNEITHFLCFVDVSTW